MIQKGRLKIVIFFIIAFAVYNNLNAQLCQGSLGDPVVNITFGAGSNYGPPLGSNITNLGNINGDCPNDGFYTIGNSTTACFNNSWHTITEDHTPGDVNGYMMIINASFAKGDFYLQKVDGLCSGVTYEFASWVLNVQRADGCRGNAIKPNVTFKIETITGDVLMSYETGDIPTIGSPQWKQYGAFFTMPAGTNSVVIRMTNNAPGGCGNDIILDDITFRPCGAKVAGTINGADVTKDLCFGDQSSVTLTGAVQPDINTAFQWQSTADNGSTWADIVGATSKTYTRGAFNAAGSYLFRLTVSQSTGISLASCRVSSNILTINVNTLPLIATTNNGPVCEGKPLVLSANGGAIYNWTGPANFTSTVQSPTITNATTSLGGKYYVTVTSNKGCVQKDSTDVSVIKGPVVSVNPTSIVLCEGDRKTLNAVGTNVVTYSWEPAKGLSASNIASPVASPVDTTTYTVTAANATCTSTASVIINVLKKPVANAGPDKEMLEGSSVSINGSVKGTDVSYTWFPPAYLSAANTATPEASPPRDTTYTLKVTSNKGCGISTDQMTVRVFKKLVIPNAFSPNGDGINDTWIINYISQHSAAEVSVFNRFGSTVFFHKGAYRPWDGTYNKGDILPSGTYYYLIDLKNGQQKYSGWLMIIK